MDPKKTTVKSWYTRPTCDSRGTYIRSPQPSAPLPPGLPAPPSSSTPPALSGPHVPSSSTLPVPLPYRAQMSVRSSVLPLPGVASFLPHYRNANGMMMVPSVRPRGGGPPRLTGGTLRGCRPPSHSASLLSTSFTSSHAKSAASSMWHLPQSAPRQASRSASSGAARYPASTPPRTGSVSGKADSVTCSSSRQDSPDCFRPVGVLLKNRQSAAPAQSAAPVAFMPESYVGGRAHGSNASHLYCAPPVSHRPWTSTTTKWTPNHSYSLWSGDNSMGAGCSYSQSLPAGSTAQQSYSMHPFSRVYPASPGSERETNQAMGMAGDGCSMSTFHSEIPPSSLYGNSSVTAVPLYDARHDAQGAQYTGDVENHGKQMTHWSRWESGMSSVKSIPDTSTTAGCFPNDVSVVTVRANDSTLFMANPGGTTSQTEREFSLHDAKMQLAEASGISEPPAPPSSPCSSLCTLSCGGAADRLQVQPIPGDEVKPHPGLDMLSDVSLLVESLTSQGSSGRSKDGQYAASSSSSNTAVSSLECGSYPSEEDVDTTLCAPQATYMGTLPPDPDSTITLPTASQIHGDILPEEEDLEYTAMNPAASVIHDVMCPPAEIMQQQYTLMLPPKKSTKFTKGSGTDSVVSDHPLQSSHKPSPFPKLSASVMSGHAKIPKQRGRPKKKADTHDDATSETHDSGTKKRGRPKKRKETKEKGVPPTGDEYWSTPAKPAKGRKRKKTDSKKMSPYQKGTSRGDEGRCAEPAIKVSVNPSTTGYEADGESNPPTRPDSGGWLMEAVPQISTSGQQSDTGGDHPARAVCKSEHSVPCTTQTSSAQTEMVTVPNGEESHATSSQESLYVENYEDTCPKVHFDPMVIAEEEVTSTQPHDNLLLPSDVSTEDRGRGKGSRRRRRSQTFTPCTCPSSDEDSSPPHSARTKPCKGASGAGASSRGHSTKSSPQSCRRCQRVVKTGSSMMCDDCDEAFPNSGQMAMKGKGDKCSLPCQVCGRAFSSSSNLSRHQRSFHPSIFQPDPRIMEFPIVASPQSRRSSISFASSVKSADSSPSAVFPEKPPGCLLPSVPSSTIPYDKTPPTPHNSPCRSPPANTPAVSPAGREESRSPESVQHGDQTDQSDNGTVSAKRRKLRRTSKQDDRDWQPPKKLYTGPYGQRVTRQDRRRARTKASGKVFKQNTAVKNDPGSCSSKCPLNFRTKKRTRINSTIPCPHCDRMFSVMSNLKRHTKRQHGDVNVFVCNVCSYKINMRRKLNKHMKNHAGTFPHVCRSCLARFRSEAEMKSHGKCHSIFRFPCADCNLIFYTEEHLGDHMAQYHVTVVSD